MAERRKLEIILEASGVRAFRRQFGDATQAVRGLSTRTERLGVSIRGAIPSLRTLGIGAAALGTAAAVAAGKFVQYGDSIDKAAIRSGFAVSELQELRFAAEQSGTSMEAVAKAGEVLSLNLGKAKAGTGELAELLKKTSPELLRVLTGTESTGEAFRVLSEAVTQLEDPTQRAALLSAAFGEAGLQLLPLLLQGPSGLDALAAKARELGLVLEDDTIAALRDAGDNLNELKNSGLGLALQLGQAVAPTLRTVTKFVVDAAKKASAFARETVGLKTIAALLAGVLAAGLVAALVAVAAVSAPIIVAFGKVAIVAAGIGVAIGGVVAIGTALALHWEELRATAQKVWTSIGEIIAGIVDAIPTGVLSLASSIFGSPGELAMAGAPSGAGAGAPVQVSVPGSAAGAALDEFTRSSRERDLEAKVGVDVRVSDDRVSATVVRGESTGGLELDAAAGPALAAAR